ncbi:MAG: hypothetical protein HLX51_02885 [Micrococcaceae bacterium]|uniref:hypothetical protein n=1 Tax=Yaniella flava TaxID=287930 RepID=UPI0017C2C184|nr:hypothetical protein [Micrococcaceae bacterium]
MSTPTGRTLLADYEQRVAAAEAELLAGLNGEHDNAEVFRDLVSRLAMNIHRADPNSDPCQALDHLD